MKDTEVKTHISKGNSKLGGAVPNVSLPPLLSCRPDALCGACGHCYALKSYKQYSGVRKAWHDNWIMALTRSGKYFWDITSYCKKHKPKRFRWHVSGDILSLNYLQGMILVADECPDTHFLCFTKRAEYIMDLRNAIPRNLNIVYSAWPGMTHPADMEAHFPIAWAVLPGQRHTSMPQDAVKCSGSCEKCQRCWNIKAGQHVKFPLH